MTSFALNYLLNSLWQVPLLFLCGWLVARLLRPLGALAEHRVWATTLVLEALLPACAFSPTSILPTLAHWFQSAGAPRGATVSVVHGPGLALASLHLSPRLLATVAILYGLFLLGVFTRFLWRASSLAALRRSTTALPLSLESTRFVEQCRSHFAIPNATVATSPRNRGPITFGLRRPLILLPASMLADLSEADLHTILAHEFAHLHRHDFAKNLLYELVSLPVTFHPLLWLTRTRVTHTREIVCDQLAATLTGRREYARSLLHLASLLLLEHPLATSHAIGILDAHIFERRLMHLTETPRTLHGLRRAVILATSAAFAVTTCTTALALRIDLTAPAAAAPVKGAPATPPIRLSSDVMAGTVLTRVNPTYPKAARDAKIQGTVILHAIIGKDGTIEKLTVISGPKELRASAVEAVHQWTYKPYVLNGEPTPVDTTVTVNYSL